jgi:hypothetical protein
MNNEQSLYSQKGISSLILLIVLVFGVFIIWETNEYIQIQVAGPTPGKTTPRNEASGSATLCVTGETDNCNDSNDVFLLP